MATRTEMCGGGKIQLNSIASMKSAHSSLPPTPLPHCPDPRSLSLAQPLYSLNFCCHPGFSFSCSPFLFLFKHSLSPHSVETLGSPLHWLNCFPFPHSWLIKFHEIQLLATLVSDQIGHLLYDTEIPTSLTFHRALYMNCQSFVINKQTTLKQFDRGDTAGIRLEQFIRFLWLSPSIYI